MFKLRNKRRPQPQPQPQMCLLQFNYCQCKGCDKNFAEFQKLVEKKYGVQKPSLDKQQGIVTVIGTGAATPKKLEELLQKTIKKKYVRILPTPKKETSEAEKGGKESNHPPPPPQQQQHPDANNMGGTSGNMQHVGESSRMGQMGQYPMGHPGAPHGQMDQTRAQYGQMEQRYQYSMDGNQESSFRTKKHQESSWNVFNDENANSCTIM